MNFLNLKTKKNKPKIFILESLSIIFRLNDGQLDDSEISKRIKYAYDQIALLKGLSEKILLISEEVRQTLYFPKKAGVWNSETMDSISALGGIITTISQLLRDIHIIYNHTRIQGKEEIESLKALRKINKISPKLFVFRRFHDEDLLGDDFPYFFDTAMEEITSLGKASEKYLDISQRLTQLIYTPSIPEYFTDETLKEFKIAETTLTSIIKMLHQLKEGYDIIVFESGRKLNDLNNDFIQNRNKSS